MATHSPALDTKTKSKLPQYGSRNIATGQNKDKPLFTAMRRPQFQQDFTTESLNNTAIGSPSPARPLHNALHRPDRSSRVAGLSAAFRRVDERNKNDGTREIPAANVRRSNGIQTRPSITRQHMSEAPRPAPKSIIPRAGSRTPSPPRGRTLDLMLSPMSEVSEASPPREFAEAYKQINDEEDLAAQDEELDTTDDIDDPSDNGNLLQAGQASSRRSSRKRSPAADDAIILDLPAKSQTETTQDSIPSLPSDLELESAKPTRHERDLHRLNLALGEAKAFSKATKPKTAIGDLQREDSGSLSGSRSEHSNTSGSILSDGSLNIPQGWGRKARQGRTWLSRLDRDQIAKENEPQLEPNLKATEDRLSTVQDWQAEASMTPLPQPSENDSLENSPSPAPIKTSTLSSRERVRYLAFGDSARLAKPQEENVQLERSPSIDTMREREIQDLARSALTTNRLGELKERRSLERVGSRSISVGSDNQRPKEIGLSDQSSLKPRPSQTSLNSVAEEQHAARSAPVLQGDENLLDNHKKSYEIKQPSKKGDLNPRNVHFPSNEPEISQKRQQPQATADSDIKISSEVQTPAPNKGLVRSTAYLKTPLVTGAWIDTPAPATKAKPDSDEPNIMERQPLSKVPDNKEDTKQPKEESRPAIQEEVKKQALQGTAPKLPGSALAAIITRAKTKKDQGTTSNADDTLLLDDSTILSLEGLVAGGEESDFSSAESEDSDGPIITKPKKHKTLTRRLVKQESDSEEEIGIPARLDRLRTSISDAKSGVSNVQKRINKMSDKNPSTATSRSHSRSRAQSDCEEAGEFHDFIWPCEKCGHRAGSSVWSADDGSLLEWHWRPLQIYMPQLWFWQPGSRIPRPTRLGFWSAVCAILIVTELVLHDIYSPPFYANKIEGFGVDLHAPRPPFILPKLFWKHVLSNPLNAIQLLLQVMVRLIAGLLGVSAGHFAPPGDPSGPASASSDWPHQHGFTFRGQSDDLGMDGDEYL